MVKFLQQFPYFQPNAALAAQGIIDPSKIGTVAQNYIKNGLIPSIASGQLFQQGPMTGDNDELTNKIDFVVSDKDRISVTLFAFRTRGLNPLFLGYPAADGPYNTFAAATGIWERWRIPRRFHRRW